MDGANRPYEGTWSADNVRPWRKNVNVSNKDKNE